MIFNIKQHYPIIFIIVLANAHTAYCQSHYIVPRVATYNSFSGIDFSVGYAFVPKYGEGEVLTRLVTVSYTHLDVYKRQTILLLGSLRVFY